MVGILKFLSSSTHAVRFTSQLAVPAKHKFLFFFFLLFLKFILNKSCMSIVFPTVTKFCILWWIIISHWTLLNLQGKCGTKCKWQMFLMVDLNERPNPNVWHLEMFPCFSKQKSLRQLDQCVMFDSEAGAWNTDNPHVFPTTWRNHFGATKKDHWVHSRHIILNPFCSDLLLPQQFYFLFYFREEMQRQRAREKIK